MLAQITAAFGKALRQIFKGFAAFIRVDFPALKSPPRLRQLQNLTRGSPGEVARFFDGEPIRMDQPRILPILRGGQRSRMGVFYMRPQLQQ